MPTVYIPQRVFRMDAATSRLVPLFDFSRAARFGSLKEVMEQGDDPLFLSNIATKISAAMEGFSEGDYLIAVGDPAVIAICAGIALRKHKSIKMLKWDRYIRDYIEMEICP